MTSTMYQSFWEPRDAKAGRSAPSSEVSRDDDGDIVVRFREDGCDVSVVQNGEQFRAFAAQVAAMLTILNDGDCIVIPYGSIQEMQDAIAAKRGVQS